MKVTLVPAQMFIPGLAEMITEAESVLVIVIVSEFDVAGLPVAHDELEVIWQLTTSPVFKVDDE